MSTENDGAQAPPPTEAEKAFAAETARFGKIEAVQAEWADDREALLGNKQPEAKNDAASTDSGAEGERDGGDADRSDDAAAEDGDRSGAAAETAGDDPDELVDDDGNKVDVSTLPLWLQKRVTRASERSRELAEREAAVKAAEEAAAAGPKPDPVPKRADFDSKEEYDEAVEAHKAALPKPAPLPLGLTQEEVSGAVATITGRVSASIAQKLGDVKVVPKLPHAVLMELAEAGPADTERMARFVIGNEAKMREIDKLPPRRQATAFREAIAVAPPAERKVKTGAPEPREPVNSRGSVGVNLSTASFGDFEDLRNKQEAEARKSGRRA